MKKSMVGVLIAASTALPLCAADFTCRWNAKEKPESLLDGRVQLTYSDSGRIISLSATPDDGGKIVFTGDQMNFGKALVENLTGGALVFQNNFHSTDTLEVRGNTEKRKAFGLPTIRHEGKFDMSTTGLSYITYSARVEFADENSIKLPIRMRPQTVDSEIVLQNVTGEFVPASQFYSPASNTPKGEMAFENTTSREPVSSSDPDAFLTGAEEVLLAENRSILDIIAAPSCPLVTTSKGGYPDNAGSNPPPACDTNGYSWAYACGSSMGGESKAMLHPANLYNLKFTTPTNAVGQVQCQQGAAIKGAYVSLRQDGPNIYAKIAPNFEGAVKSFLYYPTNTKVRADLQVVGADLDEVYKQKYGSAVLSSKTLSTGLAKSAYGLRDLHLKFRENVVTIVGPSANELTYRAKGVSGGKTTLDIRDAAGLPQRGEAIADAYGEIRLSVGTSAPEGTQVLRLDGGDIVASAETQSAVGKLAVGEAGGRIVLGNGACISFANSRSAVWSGSGVVEIIGDLSGKPLRFGTDASGLTAAQKNRLRHNGERIHLDADGFVADGALGLILLLR